ncbi:DNA-directed RNA polymerases I and III subunit RPAC1 [Chamberlinius hualienensis]
MNERLEKQRTRITLQEHGLLNTRSTDFPGVYQGYDDSWSLEKFKKNFKVKLVKYMRGGNEMEFDMIGVDASVANAFRRILISEVPTMAIEKVFINCNTSVIQDEVLAHRLGLIPINANPNFFEYRQEGDEKGTAEDTIEFKLHVKCSKNPNATKDSATPADLYKNHSVYSGQLEWVPIDAQTDLYGECGFGPVHDDILIAKLRPGHEIDLGVHCVKGIGRDHSKFSPVATATYRLLPEIILKRPVVGNSAYNLKKSFADGVIEVEKDENGTTVARVVNSRRDTGSRNYMLYDELKGCVEINRIRDHFIFSIESTGAIPADGLMIEAIKVLKGKCSFWLRQFENSEIPCLKE